MTIASIIHKAPLTNTESNLLKTTMVVIDTNVALPEVLAIGVLPGAALVILDPTLDGINQITKAIHQAGVTPTTVHLLCHGTPGSLYLGNQVLNSDTIPRYASQLRQWFPLRTTQPCHLLLYGCNIAAGDRGLEFITHLHQLTGAAIAASTQRIGSKALKGTWTLDVTTGEINVPPIFQQEVQDSYPAVL